MNQAKLKIRDLSNPKTDLGDFPGDEWWDRRLACLFTRSIEQIFIFPDSAFVTSIPYPGIILGLRPSF